MTAKRRVLIVDWLGQGGIFQTTLAWKEVLDREGLETHVLTRRGGEGGGTIEVGSALGKVASHSAVARAAAHSVRLWRPDVVIVQNYIIPYLERPVYQAARDNSARLITVVHDQQPHSRVSGTRAGLRHLLRSADQLVAHSDFVAGGVEHFAGLNTVIRVPLPLPVRMLSLATGERPITRTRNVYEAVHFGVLTRHYKGTGIVLELAARRIPDWRFVVIGVGAPTQDPSADVRPGFASAQELVDAVRAADVCLLPYRWATQSAAVLLAQAMGTVPIATGVGGVPEQIEHGVTGYLLTPGADVGDWETLLRTITDRSHLHAMGTVARERAYENHVLFGEAVTRLVCS